MLFNGLLLVLFLQVVFRIGIVLLSSAQEQLIAMPFEKLVGQLNSKTKFPVLSRHPDVLIKVRASCTFDLEGGQENSPCWPPYLLYSDDLNSAARKARVPTAINSAEADNRFNHLIIFVYFHSHTLP